VATIRLKKEVKLKMKEETPAQSEGPMDFSGALQALKRGERVMRTGWSLSGAFLFLVPGSSFHVSRPPLLGIYPRGRRVVYRPHIDMVATDGTVGPWGGAQVDLLAEDWVVITVTEMPKVAASRPARPHLASAEVAG